MKEHRSILEALTSGEADPETMAQLARGRLRNKLPQLEKALTGLMRDHHRFLLSSHLDIDFLDEQIASIEIEIENRIHEMDKAYEKTSYDENAPVPLKVQEALELLDTIPGVNRLTAELIVSELGIDMSRFPTSKHAAFWAGVAPGNNGSAGKRYSGHTTKGNQALRSGLAQAAWVVSRSKDTYLSAQYHRLAGRRGSKRAAFRWLCHICGCFFLQDAYRDDAGVYEPEERRFFLRHGSARGYCHIPMATIYRSRIARLSFLESIFCLIVPNYAHLSANSFQQD